MCCGFKWPVDFEIKYLRKRNFPIYALQKNLNLAQYRVAKRMLQDPRTNSVLGQALEKNLLDKTGNKTLKVRINFRELKIRNIKELESVEIKCEPNLTVNNLLRKAITMLYKRFDKKLKIERGSDMLYILKESDHDNFLIGEDELKQYTCYVNHLKRREPLILEIRVVPKHQLVDGYLPYNKDNKLDSINPKFVERIMKRRGTKENN